MSRIAAHSIILGRAQRVLETLSIIARSMSAMMADR
jgi:hypothetical protein